MSELKVYQWEDKEVYNVSGALLLVSGRLSVDELLEGVENTKAMSFIAPYRLDDFGYTARSADSLLRNFGDRRVGIVVPMAGSRREREDFIISSHEAGFGPIVFHERIKYPSLERWLLYLEQAKILNPEGWYHAAGWDTEVGATGRWTISTNIGEPV